MEYATVKIGDREATAKNLPLLNSIIELFFDSSIIGYLTYVNENGFVVVFIPRFPFLLMYVVVVVCSSRSLLPLKNNAVKLLLTCQREYEYS